MWSSDSTTYGHGYCTRHCYMCHTVTQPCLCTNNPMMMSQWHRNNNNVLPNSTNLLGNPQNPTIYGFSNSANHEASHEQMATNELDSWLLPSFDNNYQSAYNYQMQPHDEGIHVNYYGDFGLSASRERLVEQQQQHILNFSQGIKHDFSLPPSLSQVSLPPTDAATIGKMELPLEWTFNQTSSLPPRPVNIIEEAVGSHSNSTSISSESTRILFSMDASHKLSSYAPMSRQDRIQRYFEKKKTRKYVEKKICSSRKMYARIRPRIRGRFARTSKTDV